jgi:ubiquinone/menaquinone biosynthesis C-methylase UbiE
MLLETKKRVQLPPIQMDMRALGFKSESFDGIWACAAIMHVPKAQTGITLAELYRVPIRLGPMYVRVRKGDGDKLVTGEYSSCCDSTLFSR